jgi:hypothetical protein
MDGFTGVRHIFTPLRSRPEDIMGIILDIL